MFIHTASFWARKENIDQIYSKILCENKTKYSKEKEKKSRIRETLNFSTDADSSTDTTEGWTKNTQKPKKIKNRKNNPKWKNSKTARDMPKLPIYHLIGGL